MGSRAWGGVDENEGWNEEDEKLGSEGTVGI